MIQAIVVRYHLIRVILYKKLLITNWRDKMADLDTLTQLHKDSINHHTSELALIKREYRRKEAYKNEHNTKRN